MMCNFDPNNCSVNCKKYPICAYYAIQNQISDLQSQMNFIYTTISDILKSSETADTKLNLLESAVFKYLNDSYPIINFKESNDEKENE
jgi:hypothetical protein